MAKASDRRIFLSFSSADRGLADEINEHLREKGFTTWFLSDATPSQPTREELEKGLMTADTYVVLLSSRSISSPWVMFEIGAAVGQGKRVLPVLLSRIPAKSLPSVLRGARAVDATGKSAESIAEHVARIVSEA